MSRYVIDRADVLIAEFRRFHPDGPIKLTWHLDHLLEEGRLIEIVGSDFMTWLVILNIVQDRLMFRPEDFGKVHSKLVFDAKWPLPPIGEEAIFPDCLDIHKWNAAVERYRRRRR